MKKGHTRKGNAQSWDEQPGFKATLGNGRGHFLAEGVEYPAIVITEDCEIDKKDGAAHIAVAPVFPLTLVQDPETRDVVRAGRRYPFLPLDAIPNVIDESYADLRFITFANRKLIDAASRRVSMTPVGVLKLQRQIVAFYTRIEMKDIVTRV